MFLQSICSAVPDDRFSQLDCWNILKQSNTFEGLKDRSKTLLEKVLTGDSGIAYRRFASDEVTSLFTLSADQLNQNFERHGTELAKVALHKALQSAGLQPQALDALFICTCTGYLCPGLTSYVSDQLQMRENAYLQDIVGLGCGAAIPTLRSAQGFLAANPDATVACIAVEICSAAFYLEDDPGVLISACLFGDGASASIWSGTSKAADYQIDGFDTIAQPEHRELLRFTNKNGKLRNQLHRSVPEVAALAVDQLWKRAGLPKGSAVAAHTGGRDVLLALEGVLPGVDLSESWHILRENGNMSSPSVLFVAEHMIKSAKPPEQLWLTSFGAGFAAHSCSLVRL